MENKKKSKDMKEKKLKKYKKFIKNKKIFLILHKIIIGQVKIL